MQSIIGGVAKVAYEYRPRLQDPGGDYGRILLRSCDGEDPERLKSAYVAIFQHAHKIGIGREEVKLLNGFATARPVADLRCA